MRYLFSILFLLPFTAFSQQVIKNADFEDWHVLPNTAGVLDPDHWITNKTNDTNNISPVVINRSDDRVSGDYSIMLKPAKSATYNPGGFPKTTFLNYEDTTTFLPHKLKGYYKLIVGTFIKGAYINIGISNDTVGSIPGNNVAGGGMNFTPVSQWTPFEVDFVPVGPHAPRYLHIWIGLLTMDTNTNPVGRLFIDSLSVDFGTTNIQGAQPSVKSLVYPNPANDIVHIEWESDSEVLAIEVYDMQGRRVLLQKVAANTTHAAMVDVRALSPGIYYYELRLSGGAQQMRGKFMKE